jgi:transcriptional regulator with PAS, ATPase and Fis domain
MLADAHFHFPKKSLSPAQESAMETLEDMELVMIRKAIDKHEGNLSAVASQLGITRQTLYNKMKKYGL